MSTTNVEEPHYKRIRRHIEMRIRRGEFSSGNRLPGERDLATQFGVSQMTANRAIQELVTDGWLTRRVGSGTYVNRQEKLEVESQEMLIVLVTAYTEHPEQDVYLQAPFWAISEYTTSTNCSLQVLQSPENRFSHLVDRFPHAVFIFVAPSEDSYDTLNNLYKQHVPFVVLGASWPDAKFACVDSDNRSGASTAVEYLFRLGHQKIGFINGISSATNCRDRLLGYREGMATRGISVKSEWVVEADSNREIGDRGRRTITDLLLQREPVTAIICAGFALTLSLMELIRSMKLRIPQDVSIISFDDPSAASYMSPPLTTIKQPLYALGERAVHRALPLISGWEVKPIGVEFLPVDLIVRASCERLN